MSAAVSLSSPHVPGIIIPIYMDTFTSVMGTIGRVLRGGIQGFGKKVRVSATLEVQESSCKAHGVSRAQLNEKEKLSA